MRSVEGRVGVGSGSGQTRRRADAGQHCYRHKTDAAAGGRNDDEDESLGGQGFERTTFAPWTSAPYLP